MPSLERLHQNRQAAFGRGCEHHDYGVPYYHWHRPEILKAAMHVFLQRARGPKTNNKHQNYLHEYRSPNFPRSDELKFSIQSRFCVNHKFEEESYVVTHEGGLIIRTKISPRKSARRIRTFGRRWELCHVSRETALLDESITSPLLVQEGGRVDEKDICLLG